jgi:ADP-ribose pyrophosphatase
LRLDVLDVELESGGQSVREIVRHPGAAVVLPQLPDGRLVLVRQFRKAVEKFLVEAVAGTLEDGEDPDACALRELVEETGHAAGDLVKMGVVYPAPGYTDELLHMYYARLSGIRQAASPDEDENLEIVYVSPREFEGMIGRGEIEDAKTLAAWVLYKSRAANRGGGRLGS